MAFDVCVHLLVEISEEQISLSFNSISGWESAMPTHSNEGEHLGETPRRGEQRLPVLCIRNCLSCRESANTFRQM